MFRSPKEYKFLRKQQFLPLPSPKTIKRYLSLVNTTCGFDDKFFQLFKKKIDLLKNEERHGILVFDEIFLRESLSVNTNKLTYIGFEDLGDEITSEKYGEKADHGLVFLFRSLASSYSQPIAMFASKGPVSGKYCFIMHKHL